MPPKVSIIIPVHNSEAFLEECLDSATHQTMQDIEIICVEDGSTDRSTEILIDYSQTDNRIHVHHPDTCSAATARNFGIENSTSTYIAFLDSDDIAAPTLCQEAFQKIHNDKSDMCLFNSIRFNYIENKIIDKNAGLRSDYLPNRTPFSWKDIPTKIFQTTALDPWSKMYRRDFLIENQIFFPAMKTGEDMSFVCTALYKAQRITYTNQSLITNRRGQTTNLMSIQDKFPVVNFQAFALLCASLKADGLFNSLKISYLDRAASSLDDILKTFSSSQAGEQLYTIIHEEALEKLDAGLCLRDEAFQPHTREFFSGILQSSSYADYLFREWGKTRVQLRDARIDVKSLEESASFRIGRAITSLPREIRGKILHR